MKQAKELRIPGLERFESGKRILCDPNLDRSIRLALDHVDEGTHPGVGEAEPVFKVFFTL